MRHRKTVFKLGRTAAHRKAVLANLSGALFRQKHITTTLAKAQATRRFSEKLITMAKKESVHARRMVLRKLRDRKNVQILFDDIAPQYSERNGGYTRVIKLGQRHGDGAQMAILELVGFETAKKKKKEKEKKAADKAEKTSKEKKTAKKEEKPAEEIPAEEEQSTEQKKAAPKKTALKKAETGKASAKKSKEKSENKKAEEK